jgi:hypothetical protein
MLASDRAGSRTTPTVMLGWEYTSRLKVRAERDGEFGEPGSVQDLMSAPVTKLMSRTELPDGPASRQVILCSECSTESMHAKSTTKSCSLTVQHDRRRAA